MNNSNAATVLTRRNLASRANAQALAGLLYVEWQSTGATNNDLILFIFSFLAELLTLVGLRGTREAITKVECPNSSKRAS